MTSDKVFKGPITLFDFSREHDQADAKFVSTTRGGGGRNRARGWKMSDDGTFGGFSKGYLRLYADEMNQDGEQVEVDVHLKDANAENTELIREDNHNDEENENGTDMNTDNDTENDTNREEANHKFQPFVRWHGTLSTRLPTKHDKNTQRIHRSGFCYIRLPEFTLGGVPLRNRYNALEIKCRTDGRLYAVNLKASTFLPDDLYQGFIQIPSSFEDPATSDSEQATKSNIPVEFQTNDSVNHNNSEDTESSLNDPPKLSNEGEFVKLVLPFRDFILTAGGRAREYQRALDGNITIEHIGFMLADGEDGDFHFDLARVRAVNHSGGEIVDDEDELEYEKHEEDSRQIAKQM